MNGEKRDIGFEKTIYISLIIPAGIMAVNILTYIPGDRGSFTAFLVFAILTFAASLLLSVIGLFTGSRLLRRHLLVWYGCLVTLILTMVFVDEYLTNWAKLSDNIADLGIFVLLVLPVVWLRNASRS